MGWQFKVSESKFTILDEKQWYPARLISVDPIETEFNGKPQPKFEFSFTILSPPEFAGRKITGRVNQPVGGELNEKHRLYQWITTFRGGKAASLGDTINFPDEYINKVVEIKPKTSDKVYDGKKMQFQNVDKIAVYTGTETFPDQVDEDSESGSSQTATPSPVVDATKEQSKPTQTQKPSVVFDEDNADDLPF